MKTIISFILFISAVLVPSNAQFGLTYDTSDCAAGKLYDPYLLQALKSKYPKKFSPKLDFAKDLALDAKCRLHAAKLLARHLKNINTGGCDLQNFMYQAQQPGMVQPVMLPDQSSLYAQQQQLANYQIPIDAARSLALTATPQTDSQVSCFSQFTDPRYQQLQAAGAQSLSSLRPQHTMFQPGVSLQL